MQIKIEIEVKPEELRRFLGLPDVSGLQDDIIAFLRDKVEAAGEFHPTDFVRNNLGALKKTSAWRNLMNRVRVAEAAAPKAPVTPGATAKHAKAPRAKPASKPARGRRAPRGTGAAAAPAAKPGPAQAAEPAGGGATEK